MWNVKCENGRHVQNNVYHAIFNGCGTIASEENCPPNPNPNQGSIFLWNNCLVAPSTLKLILTLIETPTLTWKFSSGKKFKFLSIILSYENWTRFFAYQSSYSWTTITLTCFSFSYTESRVIRGSLFFKFPGDKFLNSI